MADRLSIDVAPPSRRSVGFGQVVTTIQDGIETWWVRIPDDAEGCREQLLDLLDRRTRDRVARLRRPGDRDRRTWAHALLRTVVGQRWGLAPEQVRLARDCPSCGSREHGRPIVIPPPGVAALAVSLTHTACWAGVALTERWPAIGLDLELADREFSPAAAAMMTGSGTPEAEAGWRGWVRVEAALKAKGTGLGAALGSVRIAPGLRPGAWTATSKGEGAPSVRGWDLALADLDPAAVAAVAVTTPADPFAESRMDVAIRPK